jgi:predicted MFS family arabinose efflux permease
VLTAAVLPKIRARLRPDSLVRVASLAYAAVLLVLVTQTSLLYLCPAMLVLGAAWISAMSSLQVAAQTSLPDWVRARGLAVFMMVFMGGMAGGSLLWGYLASHYGIVTSLEAAAGGLVLGLLLTWRFSLAGAESVDFTPSMHWPLPVVDQAPSPRNPHRHPTPRCFP